MERIDRALARIETQAALASHAPVDPDLAARHAALRGKVEKSLADLDALIAGIEG